MPTKKTSLYWNKMLEDKLSPLVKRHGGLSVATTIIADRYVTLMEAEKKKLALMFTPNERTLMLNNALSTRYEPGAIIPGAVLADSEDEIDETYIFYGAAKSGLIEKLKNLNLGQQFALVDWLEELRGNQPEEPED